MINKFEFSGLQKISCSVFNFYFVTIPLYLSVRLPALNMSRLALSSARLFGFIRVNVATLHLSNKTENCCVFILYKLRLVFFCF